MEKETLFIAFSTQKGGAGKTTLTVLVASYLHYVKGMNVAVVDLRYPSGFALRPIVPEGLAGKQEKKGKR